jgi:glycosyltransferase involved in cell wall biosynthesis
LRQRVLLVNTRHFRGGGDSTYTFNLAGLLRARGHEVAFFAMRDERNLPDPNADLFVDPIDFLDLNEHKSPATGLKVIGRAIYSAAARRNFARLVDRFAPDVVHLQNIHHHITPAVILEARQRGLPVVWTLHDYKLICPNTHFLIDRTGEICEACGQNRYYQAMFRRCKKGSFLASSVATGEAYVHRLMRVRSMVDVFLAPSGFLRQKFIDRGFPSERVHHLPLFLPEDTFTIGRQGDGYMLFFGRIELIKGIVPLLAASTLVPELPLVLAGRVRGSLADELPGMLPPNAQYAGMKNGDELRDLLDRARAVVLPSLWYENQPFSILEAFAAGKPVLASDLGGMRELVAGEQRGLLVPPGDVHALARAMKWVYTHPEEAREMGQQAYAYACARHSPERHYDQLAAIYDAL